MVLSVPVLVAQDIVSFDESSNEQSQPHNKSVCCFKAMLNQVGNKAWLLCKHSKMYMCIFSNLHQRYPFHKHLNFSQTTTLAPNCQNWYLHWREELLCVPMMIALVWFAHVSSHSICQRKSWNPVFAQQTRSLTTPFRLIVIQKPSNLVLCCLVTCSSSPKQNNVHWDAPWGNNSRILFSSMLNKPDCWPPLVDSCSHTKPTQNWVCVI
jgi:hypothetical protein